MRIFDPIRALFSLRWVLLAEMLVVKGWLSEGICIIKNY